MTAERDAAPGARRMLVVLGMHRSGTSSFAGTFARLGATLPRSLMAPQPDNPSGFYESDVIARFNDELLLLAGRQWDDWRPLDPCRPGKAASTESGKRAAAILRSEFGDASLAVVKDPRMCRLLPTWRRAFAEAGYAPFFVVPLRPAVDVARSLHRRSGMPLPDGLLLWLRHVIEAERNSRNADRCFITWSSFLEDWRGVVQRLSDMIGGALPSPSDAAAAAIDAYLDKSLRHHDAAAAPGGGGVAIPDWVTEAEAALLSLAGPDPAKDARRRLDNLDKEFGRACQAFLPLLPIARGSDAPSVPATAPRRARQELSVLNDAEPPPPSRPDAADPVIAFVHNCIRKRLRPDDDPLVTAYTDKVFREGRREHTVRTMETLRILRKRHLLPDGVLVAESGALGDVGEHLVETGYGCEIIGGDLRQAFEAPDDRYDLLLSLEVFEHIKDHDAETLAELVVFNGSGIRRFAEECWRVVKPGGHLVITTPNACSLFSIVEALQGRPPMLWRQHVREYTAEEVSQVFEPLGFRLEHFTTWYAYHLLDPDDIEPLCRRYLDGSGANRENRGDDMCFVFRKPDPDALPR